MSSILALLVVYGLAVNQQAKMVEGENEDAKVSLGRHYVLMREACLGLMDKIKIMDDEHLTILIEATVVAQDIDADDVMGMLRLHDRLTRPFTMKVGDDLATVLLTPDKRFSLERYRGMTPTEEQAAAYRRHVASRPKLPDTLN